MSDAELNEPQAHAVAHTNGPLLVFAGAGSGKTRVITYRIANLVACGRVPPYRILAVTFTNKAASEMRSRLVRLLGEPIARDLWVGTFHAICAKLLRTYGESVGKSRNFVIYDAADQKALVTRVLKELDYDDRRYPPRAALEWIHRHKQEGRAPKDVSLDSYLDDAWIKVYEKYEAQLAQANAVDFEDLILLVSRILAQPNHPDAERIRRRFEYVLVDEFQDTNATQYRFLRDLVREHRNLCVVGDDDQSIYRWRGADVRNIRGFRKDFPDANVVKLEQNYRSTARIVKAALSVIAPSKQREPKELWTANADGDPVTIVAAQNERDEAAFVIQAIQEARREGIDPREIAVFYRVNAQSRVLEEALRSVNIPYQIIGGMRFYERAEVKNAIAYLRILVNPSSDVDLLRIINTPARGIGATTIDRLTTFSTFRNLAVFDALGEVDQIDDLAVAAKKKLALFRALLDDLRGAMTHASPSALLEQILDRTGYKKTLQEEDSAEGDARLENLRELYGSMRDYEAEATAAGEAASIDGFLERVTLQSSVDELDNAERVTLMTVHSAKGLEFDVVLLTGMEEEMFPYKGMDPAHDEDLEEERRLAYVALTRARRRLFLSHVQMRQIFGNTRWGRPSRFLLDLPPEIVMQAETSAMGSAKRMAAHRIERTMPSGPWRHPQAPARPASRDDDARYVDTEFFDDAPAGDFESLRRGSRVFHERFGQGEVRRVEHIGEPTVVAFFPGWGEKKIRAKFLKLA